MTQQIVPVGKTMSNSCMSYYSRQWLRGHRGRRRSVQLPKTRMKWTSHIAKDKTDSTIIEIRMITAKRNIAKRRVLLVDTRQRYEIYRHIRNEMYRQGQVTRWLGAIAWKEYLPTVEDVYVPLGPIIETGSQSVRSVSKLMFSVIKMCAPVSKYQTVGCIPLLSPLLWGRVFFWLTNCRANSDESLWAEFKIAWWVSNEWTVANDDSDMCGWMTCTKLSSNWLEQFAMAEHKVQDSSCSW